MTETITPTPENGTQTATPQAETVVTPEGGNIPPPSQDPPAVAPIEPKKPEIDYRKKFSDSTRRNQIVEAQIKELQKTLGDLTKEDIPTDDEMRRSDPDWDFRDDFQKNLAIKVEATQRMNRRISVRINSIVDESERATSISLLCENDPRLSGKEDDFFRYASKPEHSGVPVDILINAFLFEARDDDLPPAPVAPVTPPAPVTPELPPSMERGNPSGGRAPSSNTPSGQLSPDQLRELRTKNPREYNRMIQKGLIK